MATYKTNTHFTYTYHLKAYFDITLCCATGSLLCRDEIPKSLSHACESVFALQYQIIHCLIVPFVLTLGSQPTPAALKGAIQLGIGYTVGNLSSKPERDVLMQDFYVVESIFFPRCVSEMLCVSRCLPSLGSPSNPVPLVSAVRAAT